MSNQVCPKCGTKLEPYAEVDIGVGIMQGGPWGCPRCHWVEEADPAFALPEPCPQMMNGIGCSKPIGHTDPHEFAEDFL